MAQSINRRAVSEPNANKPIELKLLVDKSRNRVLCAECDKDFVDVLFSFLMLPMGRIIKLRDNESRIGSMNKLYESVKKLDSDYFCTKACKNMLLKPRRASKFLFNKLPSCYDRCRSGLVSLVRACGKTTNENFRCKTSNCLKGFIKIKRRFMVTDDFQVVPAEIDSVRSLLIRQRIDDNTGVREETVRIDIEEVLELLHRSLLSKTPLTDVFYPRTANDSIPPLHSLLRNDQSHTHCSRNRSSHYRDINVKLWFSRSTRTVICVEAKNDFVDFLFSFLTLTLASVIERLKGEPQLGSIDNLYRSARNLRCTNIVHRRNMEMILSPKIRCNNNLLGILEPDYSFYSCRPCKRTTRCGGFVKWERCFFVTDSLRVEPQSPISVIPRLNIPFADLGHIQVRVEKKEAITLLRAALTSETALNQAFGSLLVNNNHRYHD